MGLEKRVLLARPHAFIVSEMRPFLVDAGYTPVRIESLDQLAQELRHPTHGAIISTAVSSSVNADAATVFKAIRERAPRLPAVFAGMADFETMKVVAGDRWPSFLVLRKDDIAGASRDAAQRHQQWRAALGASHREPLAGGHELRRSVLRLQLQRGTQ